VLKKIFQFPYNLFACQVLIILWFIPWVWSLNLGFLIYFPYHQDGESRFFSVKGPLAETLGWDKTWTSQIPSACAAALVAAEDSKFYQHWGLDLQAIQSNIEKREKLEKSKSKSKKKVGGASTITQQIVKNAFLSRDQSWIRKAREAVGAVLLHFFMAKEEQIKWYFNIVEFGSEIYGIENAAQAYFKTSAKNLNAAQCISLVAILPAPKKWNQALITKKDTPFFRKRAKVILARVQIMGLVGKKELVAAIQKWGAPPASLPSQSLPDLPELVGVEAQEMEEENSSPREKWGGPRLEDKAPEDLSDAEVLDPTAEILAFTPEPVATNPPTRELGSD
jgi:monofunctional biosynthetic peptidoglycan transglycosylase